MAATPQAQWDIRYNVVYIIVLSNNNIPKWSELIYSGVQAYKYFLNYLALDSYNEK